MGAGQSARVNGQQPFLASDHQALPIHEPAAAANRGPLDPLIAVLQTYPRILLAIVVMLAVLLVFAIVGIALIAQTKSECDRPDNGDGGGGGGSNGQYTCGWNGRDLSPLSSDLTFLTSNNNQYFLRPCGFVANSFCSNRFGGLSQACTFESQAGVVVNSGNWLGNNGGGGTWSNYNQGSGGVVYHTSNGEACGSGSRSLYVTYVCDAGTLGYISTVDDANCVTHYYVNTQYACI